MQRVPLKGKFTLKENESPTFEVTDGKNVVIATCDDVKGEKALKVALSEEKQFLSFLRQVVHHIISVILKLKLMRALLYQQSLP